jgi:plastocyanin
MPGCVARRHRPPSFARVRGRTLLLSVAVFTASLALPATLVSAQEAVPSDPGAEQAATGPGTAGSPAPAEAGQPPVGAAPGADAGAPPAPTPGEPASPAPTTPSASTASVAAAGDASVSIVGNSPSAYAFSPASITIQAGDVVSWTNNSNASEGHNVTGSGFSSGTLHSGQSYSHTFASAGTFSYVCTIHPFMKGSVRVVASGSGGGGGGNGTSASGTAATGTTPTAPGSESAAGASPGAAGSATQLPSTGLPLLPLLATGLALLALGVLLRRSAGRDGLRRLDHHADQRPHEGGQVGRAA